MIFQINALKVRFCLIDILSKKYTNYKCSCHTKSHIYYTYNGGLKLLGSLFPSILDDRYENV